MRVAGRIGKGRLAQRLVAAELEAASYLADAIAYLASE
jgi:hypothetical protein